MIDNENIHSIHEEQKAGIDERAQDGPKNIDPQDSLICLIEAIVLYELDHPGSSCVWRVSLPDYQPHLDENDPLEKGIQKVFQETPADIAKTAIDDSVKMIEEGAILAKIDKVLVGRLNRSARFALKNVLENVQKELSQLANLKAITLARWQTMQAITKEVNQRLLECRQHLERETEKRPNKAEYLCLLILRLRLELNLNYGAIGAIVGLTEENTRQKAHRCYEKLRPYFKRCHELFES